MREWPPERLRGLRRRRMIIRLLVILGPLVFWMSRTGIPSSAAAALDEPDSFELLSIHPRFHNQPRDGYLHGYRILGRTPITDPSVRHRLPRNFKWGARLSFSPLGGYACFDPRHAIRVTHGQTTVDFLICFHCEHVEVYSNNSVQIGKFDICGFPESTFDEILQKAGVPLAPKDERGAQRS